MWPGSACQESAGVGCRAKTNLGSVGLGRVSRVEGAGARIIRGFVLLVS